MRMIQVVDETVPDRYIPFLAQYSEDIDVIGALRDTRITEVQSETTDDD